jgi:hypothetical protein
MDSKAQSGHLYLCIIVHPIARFVYVRGIQSVIFLSCQGLQIKIIKMPETAGFSGGED